MFFKKQKEIYDLKLRNVELLNQIGNLRIKEEADKPKNCCAICGVMTTYIPTQNIKYCRNCQDSISWGRIIK